MIQKMSNQLKFLFMKAEHFLCLAYEQVDNYVKVFKAFQLLINNFTSETVFVK